MQEMKWKTNVFEFIKVRAQLFLKNKNIFKAFRPTENNNLTITTCRSKT